MACCSHGLTYQNNKAPLAYCLALYCSRTITEEELTRASARCVPWSKFPLKATFPLKHVAPGGMVGKWARPSRLQVRHSSSSSGLGTDCTQHTSRAGWHASRASGPLLRTGSLSVLALALLRITAPNHLTSCATTPIHDRYHLDTPQSSSVWVQTGSELHRSGSCSSLYSLACDHPAGLRSVQ